MRPPDDPQELELMHRAIRLIESEGCFEWDEEAARRVWEQGETGGLTLDGVREAVLNAIDEGRQCEQNFEKREGRNRRYFYDIVVECPEYENGLYVEMVSAWRDQDYPEARIVNAHKAT